MPAESPLHVCAAGQLLSMGYGFVEYKTSASASKALKVLQHTVLDGHQLELKLSNRTTLWVFIMFASEYTKTL